MEVNVRLLLYVREKGEGCIRQPMAILEHTPPFNIGYTDQADMNQIMKPIAYR
jgi:hypothetical protein